MQIFGIQKNTIDKLDLYEEFSFKDIEIETALESIDYINNQLGLEAEETKTENKENIFKRALNKIKELYNRFIEWIKRMWNKMFGKKEKVEAELKKAEEEVKAELKKAEEEVKATVQEEVQKKKTPTIYTFDEDGELFKESIDLMTSAKVRIETLEKPLSSKKIKSFTILVYSAYGNKKIDNMNLFEALLQDIKSDEIDKHTIMLLMKQLELFTVLNREFSELNKKIDSTQFTSIEVSSSEQYKDKSVDEIIKIFNGIRKSEVMSVFEIRNSNLKDKASLKSFGNIVFDYGKSESEKKAVEELNTIIKEKIDCSLSDLLQLFIKVISNGTICCFLMKDNIKYRYELRKLMALKKTINELKKIK